MKQVLDPTTSSRSKTLVTQRASIPRVVSKGSNQVPQGVEESLELRKQSVKSSKEPNQYHQRTDSIS